MNKRFFYLLLFFLCLGFTPNLIGQTLNINQFGIEEGLPQSGIHALAQDNQGNIWMGTLGGISRYNGLAFENFTQKNGLAENRTLSIYIDKNQNIWFGHWGGGITRYNPSTKKFHEVSTGSIELLESVLCIYQDSAGIVYFGTKGHGILTYTPSESELKKGFGEKEQGSFSLITTKNGLSNNIVNTITGGPGNSIWAGTENGVSVFENPKGNFKFINYLDTKSGLPQNIITSIVKDKNGNMWIGTAEAGIAHLFTKEKKIKLYNSGDGLSSNQVKVIFEDKKGNVFIGTFGGGVSKYLPALEANHYKGPIFQTISTEQGLSNDRVLSIIQDREQNLWIGTYLNLNQYFDEQFEIYGSNEGLANSLVWAVAQDKKGNFWLGTEGGLIQFKEGLNSNKSTFINFTNKKGNKIFNTTALYVDIYGNVWYTDFGNGVSRLNPETGKITTYLNSGKTPVREVYAIEGDAEGNVWIATNKNGIYRYNIRSDKFDNFSTKDGLGSNQVYTIFKDSKKRLWFGCLGGPLTLYNGKAFTQFKEQSGYHSNFTLCITEDPSGNLWFGTYNKGIYQYDGKTFTNYSTKNGANSDSPYLLVSDNKNNIWIGTGLGIDKFNIKDKSFKHYGKHDGFLGIEINPNAVCKDRNGNLWFGSIIGLVKYTPLRERHNQVEPVTILKSPRLFFKPAAVPENHEYSYNQNHLTFDFIGASLTNPQRVKYQYFLEGLDKEWSPVVKDNYVTYPNLPSGSYTFKLKACNNDGVWNKEPVTFSFVITPPFWRTWWFYTLVLLVVALSVYLFIKNRERNLILRNKELEEKVEVRTEQLRIEKENVERQNIEINQQKIELENKNQNITDSIDAAKSIQDAVLPPESHFKQLFPESFILYMPKDIVSGDFYWTSEWDNKLLVAAADCTGHGVPGAFMSMLGHNLLDKIVKESNLTQPSVVLDRLNQEIISVLHQNKDNSKVRSGMDIALLSIDKKKKLLQFAGAHNPLYLFRNKELIEIKADKLSIGNYALHVKLGNRPFTNHEIPLEEGDVLYIFSDGFPDQIGGPERKKFFYQPFKDFLQSICTDNPEEQKRSLQERNLEWRRHYDQTDDILVLGLKISSKFLAS